MTKAEEAAQLTWRADRLRGQADYLDREAKRLLSEDTQPTDSGSPERTSQSTSGIGSDVTSHADGSGRG